MVKIIIVIHTIFSFHYTAIEFVAQIISVLIFTALKEEVIFRGFLLFGLISRGISPKSANMIQAIIFGLIHIDAIGKLVSTFTLVQIY